MYKINVTSEALFMTCTKSFKFEFKKDQIKCICCNFNYFTWSLLFEDNMWNNFVTSCQHLLRGDFFFFLIFQNQRMVGNVIQLNKKKISLSVKSLRFFFVFLLFFLFFWPRTHTHANTQRAGKFQSQQGQKKVC